MSPKACEGKPLVLGSEANRFCRAVRASQCGKLLAEPRLVTFSGRAATFLSGGQQAVPEVAPCGRVVGTRFEPFGVEMKFLPKVLESGKVCMEVDANVSTLNPGNGYTVGGVAVAGRDEHRARSCVTLSPGQTCLMHGGRDQDGHDLIAMFTPQIVDVMDPTPRAVAVAPIMCMPIPGPAICPMPAPVMPTVWTAPMPMPVVPAAAEVPASEPKLAKMMARYQQACAAGDTAKARKFAEKCMAIDPTCFAK